MKRMITCAAVAAALFAGAPRGAAAGDKTGTIIVTAVGFKNKQGNAIIALYKQGESWLKMSKAFRRQVVPMSKMKKGVMRFKLRNVPYGEYGVAVLHDKNENGKLDMRWLPWPKPKEHGGVSNNWVRKGKPRYSDAKFDFSRRIMSLRIYMRR